MKLPLLMFLATFLGSIPIVAVVSHKRNPPEPMIYPAVKNPNGLQLYNPEGEQVAVCAKVDHGAEYDLSDCTYENDSTLTDVMNAWAKAYESK